MPTLLFTLALAAFALLSSPASTEQDDAESAPRERQWILQVGAGSPHAWNLVGLTREFSGSHLRPFVTFGLGSFLVGGGVVYYTNSDATGLVFSAVGGMAGAQVAAALDVRVSRRAGFVIGGSYGNYFLQYVGPLAVASLQVRQ